MQNKSLDISEMLRLCNYEVQSYLQALLKDFHLLTALWRFALEHIAVVGFGRGGVFGQRRIVSILCNEQRFSSLKHTSTLTLVPPTLLLVFPKTRASNVAPRHTSVPINIPQRCHEKYQ